MRTHIEKQKKKKKQRENKKSNDKKRNRYSTISDLPNGIPNFKQPLLKYSLKESEKNPVKTFFIKLL